MQSFWHSYYGANAQAASKPVCAPSARTLDSIIGIGWPRKWIGKSETLWGKKLAPRNSKFKLWILCICSSFCGTTLARCECTIHFWGIHCRYIYPFHDLLHTTFDVSCEWDVRMVIGRNCLSISCSRLRCCDSVYVDSASYLAKPWCFAGRKNPDIKSVVFVDCVLMLFRSVALMKTPRIPQIARTNLRSRQVGSKHVYFWACTITFLSFYVFPVLCDASARLLLGKMISWNNLN